MRIVCVGVIPVLSPAWRCAGSLCHHGSGVEAAFRQKRAARSGTVIGAAHQSGRSSFEYAGRTQVLALALPLIDLEEDQNRDHAR